MKHLFMVGAKLIGILCLWEAIFTTCQIISFFPILGPFNFPYQVIALLLHIMGTVAYFILGIWSACVLLFRTEWVCKKVGIENGVKMPNWPEQKTLLYLGIVLIGFYLLALAIPSFAKSSFSLIAQPFQSLPIGINLGTFIPHYVIPLLVNILQIFIGVLLIVKPAEIIKWAEKWQKRFDEKLVQTQ